MMEQQRYELPVGWESKFIGEAVKLEYGKPLPKDDRDEKGAFPAYGANGVKCWTNKFFVDKPSIIVGRKGSAGEVTLTEDKFWPLDVTYFVTFDEKTYDLIFLYYCLKSLKLTKLAKGVKPGINRNNVYQIKFSFPPLNEQRRIVDKLDALFTRIDTAISHLQETLELSKALFASTLDTKFSNLSDRVRISDIAAVKGGKRLPKGNKLQDKASNHPYIRVADFTDTGSIDMDGLKYLSDEIYQQIKRYTINSNDLYISIAGTIGKTGIIPKELDGANLTENAAKLVFIQPNNIDVKYVYYFTLSHDFSEQAGLATRVVAQPKLALSRLSKIQIPVPPVGIQQQIVARLDALSERTRTLEAATQEKLDDLTALKASLLDVAFRGQL